MIKEGYSEDLLNPEQKTLFDEFICPICQLVSRDPKACSKCKKTFCVDCIKYWLERSTICPFKCSQQKMNLIDISDLDDLSYFSITIKCKKKCSNFIPVLEYSDHMAFCELQLCDNNAECGKKIKYFCNGGIYCSEYCYKQRKLEINLKKALENIKNTPTVLKDGFMWKLDFKKSSKNFTKLSNTACSLSSSEKVYQTLVSKVGICGTVVKFAFMVKGASYNFKVGVSSDVICPENSAFADIKTGFAFSTIGQTRNGELSCGNFYGKKLDYEKENVIIVELNMGIGTLKFWANGQSLDTAFEAPELTKGVWFPAISVCGNTQIICLVN